MGFLNRLQNAWIALTTEPVGLNDEELLEWLGIRGEKGKRNISEITYFTCLKMLSETMGKLPLKYYQYTDGGQKRAELSDMAYVLSVRPNAYMTPSTLWSTVEMNCQHYGNGYVWLKQELISDGKYGAHYKVHGAYPMQSNYVSVIMDDIGVFGDTGKLYYQYTDPRSGELYLFRSDEVLHIKTWYSLDGIMGEPVRNILEYTISGSTAAQEYMNNLYKNGLSASMALQYMGDLDEGKRKKLENKFAKALSGPRNAGKVIPIPMGLQLQPLKMNPTDAQFFELRKFSALQIAGAFGIKPNQINNYEKASYANSEMQQLTFLVDTMSYRLKQYEEELNAKALTTGKAKEGYFFKFNEKAILRTNTKDQMETLKGAVNNGIYTANEARAYMDLPAKEGGDVLMVNGNYIPITMVGKQYEKGGDGNADGN